MEKTTKIVTVMEDIKRVSVRDGYRYVKEIYEDGTSIDKCYYFVVDDVNEIEEEHLKEEWRYDNKGRTHSFNDEPAYIAYATNGQIIEEEWHLHGELHREVGGAAIEYYLLNESEYGDDAQEKEVYYYLNGELDNSQTGYNNITYNRNGEYTHIQR